jgi:enoyl-CoA hydratase
MDERVGIERGEVHIVTLRHTVRRNAVDGAMARALYQAVLDFEADEEARVLVLCGEGGTFCAGADLKALTEGRGNPIEPMPSVGAGSSSERSDRGALPHSLGPMGPTRLVTSKPTIAALSGYAVAGGLELALWCDLRVCEEDTTLGVFCRRFGVPLIDGGTVRLPRLIGLSRALDLILTGRPVGADEALSMGLVNRVVGRGEARDAAVSLARSLCTLPWRCLVNDRRATYDGLDLASWDALTRELELGLDTLASGETLAGAERFRAGAGRHGGTVAPGDGRP